MKIDIEIACLQVIMNGRLTYRTSILSEKNVCDVYVCFFTKVSSQFSNSWVL